jgi:hypothetical protein
MKKQFAASLERVLRFVDGFAKGSKELIEAAGFEAKLSRKPLVKRKKVFKKIVRGSLLICFDKSSEIDLSPVFSMFNRKAELPAMRDRDRDRAAFLPGQSRVVRDPQRAVKRRGGVR